jgi:hypothetical protein
MSVQRNHLSRGIPSFARKLVFVVSVVACIALTLPTTIHAQVTSGNIAGTVSDPSSGPLPGVTVEAIHVPTGTHYSTVSEAGGRFTIPNVRVGGPYKLTATLEGMKPAEVNNVQVSIGTTTEVPLNMRLTAVSESITVTARPDDVINPNHVGSSTTVAEKQIESLPTINRSLQDFARTNPYFVVDPRDDSATTMQVAGRNNRYNNIQIDGAVNNDLFGLAATGTPGGQSNAQPISLDAIEQIQLVVSPYDVRQGGFTGGGVNVVTRSGSNKLAGSLYGTKRNESSVGKAVPVFTNTVGQVGCCFNGNGTTTAITDKPIVSFDYSQYGGRLGGPIMQDKLFFFVNGERNRRSQPDGTSADGSAGTTYANATQDAVCSAVAGCSAARLKQDLITKRPDPAPQLCQGRERDRLQPEQLAVPFPDFDLQPGEQDQLHGGAAQQRHQHRRLQRSPRRRSDDQRRSLDAGAVPEHRDRRREPERHAQCRHGAFFRRELARSEDHRDHR